MRQYRLGLYEKAMPPQLTWQEKLQAAHDSGFDFLEISIDETDEKLARLDMSEQEISEIAGAMEQTQIYLRTMCLSGHRRFPLGSHDPKIRERAIEILKKAVELSWRLGIRVIQLAGYDVYYEEPDDTTREMFEENLRRCVDIAAGRGVMLGFETMETAFMNTVEKAMVYVNAVGSPYLTIYPDIGNLTNAAVALGRNPHDDLSMGKGHICAAHLKETKPDIFREVPFGTGHTDFVGCVQTLRSMGVRMFTGEFWYVGSLNWREELAQSGQFLHDKLQLAFDAPAGECSYAPMEMSYR